MLSLLISSKDDHWIKTFEWNYCMLPVHTLWIHGNSHGWSGACTWLCTVIFRCPRAMPTTAAGLEGDLRPQSRTQTEAAHSLLIPYRTQPHGRRDSSLVRCIDFLTAMQQLGRKHAVYSVMLAVRWNKKTVHSRNTLKNLETATCSLRVEALNYCINSELDRTRSPIARNALKKCSKYKNINRFFKLRPSVFNTLRLRPSWQPFPTDGLSSETGIRVTLFYCLKILKLKVLWCDKLISLKLDPAR